jgi:hypothetical protein
LEAIAAAARLCRAARPGRTDTPMTEKFDIPYKSGMVPRMLEPESKLRFRCYKGISCFNACCRHADVTLAPYDIIRLKGRLGMGSPEFLKRHTVPFQMDAQGVPGVKLKTDDTGTCLFMDAEAGCTVYEDRPTACRYYPVGLLTMKPADVPSDRQNYFLIQEAHCKGHLEDRELTVEEYREEQGVKAYDDLSREWYQIMLKKKSAGPAVGQPSEMSLQVFFMASYDIDRFRRFVMSDNFRAVYDLEEGFYESVAEDDIALLRFAYTFLRQVLFGERSIPEHEGAWDRRMQERKEVWEARAKAEIERRNAERENAMRDAT